MINSVHLLTTAGPLAVDDSAGAWPGAEVAAAFAEAVESGRFSRVHDARARADGTPAVYVDRSFARARPDR